MGFVSRLLTYFEFDGPTTFHTLAPRGDEISRVDVAIRERE